VKVTVPWTGGRQMRSTGNSFATPHISGICALILGKHPALTPFQLKSVLYLNAGNVSPGNRRNA
jgi:subtilisin